MKLNASLIAEVLENPEDDTPRLAYAEWCSRNDEPELAEFIWVQCQIARLPADDKQRLPLAFRERELLEAHGEDWVQPLADYGLTEWRFERGFLTSIEIDRGSTFRWALEDILRHHPIRDLRLADPDLDLDDLISGLPGLRTIKRFEIGLPPLIRQQDHEQVAEVVRSPHLAQLSGFGISSHGDDHSKKMNDIALEAILDSSLWLTLYELNIAGFQSTNPDAAFERLADRLRDSSLRIFVLQHFWPDQFSALQLLFQSLPFSNLRGLWLHNVGPCNVDDVRNESDHQFDFDGYSWDHWFHKLTWLKYSYCGGEWFEHCFHDYLSRIAKPLWDAAPMQVNQFHSFFHSEYWFWNGLR